MWKLTVKGIEHAGPGEHYHGDGLILIVGTGNARSWHYRYSLGGKRRQMGSAPPKTSR